MELVIGYRHEFHEHNTGTQTGALLTNQTLGPMSADLLSLPATD